MSEVKTYAVNCNDAWLNIDGDDVSGSYVKYADYKALATRLDIAERACAAMAAENVGLKQAFNPAEIPEEAVEAFTETAIMDHDWNDTSEWSWVENDTDVIRAVLEAIKPETPATDAFLAEIERKAIRKFINSIEHILRDKLSPYDTEEMLEAMRIFLEEQEGEQK